MIKIGLILGYGVSLSKNFEKSEDLNVSTPYGATSSSVYKTFLGDIELIALSRHGEEEKIPSFMVNYKANIYALHELGCTHIMSTSICGSLQEEICIGDFVVFNQFIDLSTHKELSFSDKLGYDKLNHSAFSNPFTNEIRDAFIQSSITQGITVHTKGTVVAVDGPRQSTRAESNLFRSWRADVVNTTTVPEAILAHELNIKYGAISLCTYYDTWRTDIPPATRAEKMEELELNAEKFTSIIKGSIDNLSND